MLARQRQARIVDEVRRHGGVRVSDLTSLLEVSDMTVRRDLEELARQGLLQKVHGGAVPPSNSADEPGFEAKSAREQQEKQAHRRGRRGAGPAGSGAGLSAPAPRPGPWRPPARVPDITVVTNSVRVADAFQPAARPGPDRDAHRRRAHALGRARRSAGRRGHPALHFDVLFLGVHGMDPRRLHHSQPRRGGDQPGAGGPRAGWSSWPTTPSGDVVGLASFAAAVAADVVITDDGLQPRSARRCWTRRSASSYLAAVGHADTTAAVPTADAVTAYGAESRLADGRVLYYFDAEPGVVPEGAVDEHAT